MPARPLDGRCALVTGSTRGLGLAIGQRLAADGCHVMLHGVEEASAVREQLASLRGTPPTRAHYHQADLRDVRQIEGLLAATVSELGAVDILVNNAVVRHFAPVEAFPDERWDEALAVNLSAPFHLIKRALPGMRARNWGRIINLSSTYGFFASAGRIDYVTTKTALLGVTRTVALETAQSGVTCNAVCPGTIRTPNIQSRILELAERKKISEAEAVAEYMTTRQPSGRFVPAEDVANLIAFLCSPGGNEINGAALPIDGAWMAS